MTDQSPTAPLLWLTSRSMLEEGSQHCEFSRYVRYHAGPFGSGFSRRAQSLPLVTGTHGHVGIALVVQWIMEARQRTGVQPSEAPDEVIRWAVEVALEKYTKICTERGVLQLVQDNPDAVQALQDLIREQCWLIEGLTWVFCLNRLPQILEEYLIVASEQEEEYVRNCTCGLGDGTGTFMEHSDRGCAGIGWQSKPDLLLERRSDGKYCYTEFKFNAVANKAQNESWARKQQFVIGILGAEARYGVECSHYVIETLVKGKRDKLRENDWQGPKYQSSPLCYAYYQTPAPPVAQAEWKPAYNYFDRDGVKHTASRPKFRRTGLWEPPREDAWPHVPEGMSISEYWVRQQIVDYPVSAGKYINTVGPLPKQHEQIEKALRAMVAEETKWQSWLGDLYDFQMATGKGWGDDEFMTKLEDVIPRSWHCDPFAEHPCPNQPICHPTTEDWRDPVGNEMYVYRTPHHEGELLQVVARGLTPAEGLAVEDDELDEVEAGE